MSAGLQRLLAEADAADIALHSLEVSVEGRRIVSSGVAPFGPAVPHRMYSVSKTFTGIAILLLAEEGRLELTDGILTHFRERGPGHPWLAETTIDHMLAMVGPHSRTTYVEASSSWLPSYFETSPTHRPGALFTYDTSASYVLAALVERLSGMPVLEYLRARLLDPLGIGGSARFLNGPEGISHGGSGLIMAPADLLPIAETLNGAGLHGGRRILPERVVTRLVETRSDPGTQTWGAPLRVGYGRQTWLPGGRSWLMFGLGGQIVYGDPDRALAAVLTADTTTLVGGDQRLLEMLLRARDGFDADSAETCVLRPPTPPHDAADAVPVRGTAQRVSGEGAPERIAVDVDEGGGSVEYGTRVLTFATGGPLVADTDLGPAVITAGWSAAGVLDIRVSAVADDIASVRMRVVTSPDGVLTVLSQGFGPAIDASWTWRGSYTV